MHRPDFQPFAGHNKSIIYRDSYIWPYINQEKLLTTKILPMLLNSRGRHHPSNLTAVDFGATNMGMVSKAARFTFLENYTMIINGLIENIKDYGKLVA